MIRKRPEKCLQSQLRKISEFSFDFFVSTFQLKRKSLLRIFVIFVIIDRKPSASRNANQTSAIENVTQDELTQILTTTNISRQENTDGTSEGQQTVENSTSISHFQNNDEIAANHKVYNDSNRHDNEESISTDSIDHSDDNDPTSTDNIDHDNDDDEQSMSIDNIDHDDDCDDSEDDEAQPIRDLKRSRRHVSCKASNGIVEKTILKAVNNPHPKVTNRSKDILQSSKKTRHRITGNAFSGKLIKLMKQTRERLPTKRLLKRKANISDMPGHRFIKTKKDERRNFITSTGNNGISPGNYWLVLQGV